MQICNAVMFQSSVDKSINWGHQIAIYSLKFPSEQVNHPEGIENFTTMTSPEQSLKIAQAKQLLQKPMEDLIRSLSPDCIFPDMFFPWSVDLALELNIPRLMFFASSFFYQCIDHTLKPYAHGWNSVLEAMVAGVPLITWPLFAEQFYNERLIIQILGNGVEVGSDVWNFMMEIKSPVIDKQKIENAVVRLMVGSSESKMIRRRAEELSVMAKRATEEGGSSCNDLAALIQDIKMLQPRKSD